MRSLRRLFVIGALAAMISAAGATPALAANAPADDALCPANRFCLFQKGNFTGGRAQFSTSDGDLMDNHYDNSALVYKTATSMINNTGHNVILFQGIHDFQVIYTAVAHQ